MKTLLIKSLLFVALLAVCGDTYAQRNKKTRSTKKSTTKKSNKPAPVVDQPVQAPAMKLDSLPIKMPLASFENDNTIERLLVKDRVPLPYEHIREDDAVYRQRLWRNIDTREKMNQAFRYDADEDNGNQLFINILLTAVQKGEIEVYNPIDDRFTTKTTKEEIVRSLVGEPITIRVPDWPKDPTGNTYKDSVVINEFNPSLINKFQIKEEVIFDKESSRLFTRILGIAPLQDITDPVTGAYRGEKKLFWVYYPKFRASLAKYEAYNGKNWGARMTWEELFESRMFSSYIVKSTLDNPSNIALEQIPGLKDNGILRLWEGENIKNKIFDYEQNLWSY
jgi:gliding motility associated protien GldN